MIFTGARGSPSPFGFSCFPLARMLSGGSTILTRARGLPGLTHLSLLSAGGQINLRLNPPQTTTTCATLDYFV